MEHVINLILDRVADLAKDLEAELKAPRALVSLANHDGLPLYSVAKLADYFNLQTTGTWTGHQWVSEEPESLYAALLVTVVAYTTQCPADHALFELQALRIVRQ